jgi:hypothetical protein
VSIVFVGVFTWNYPRKFFERRCVLKRVPSFVV